MTSLQRSFFEMAASIAQQGVESLENKGAALTEDFMLRSSTLEQDYQDCLFTFVARGKRMHVSNINSVAMAMALNKYSQGRIFNEAEALLTINSATFARDLAVVVKKATQFFDWPDHAVTREEHSYSADEIMALFLWIAREAIIALKRPLVSAITAPLFHEQLTKMVHEKNRRPFIFASTNVSNTQDILVDQASLFSANRLKRKSQQNSMGASHGIRYYHAVLSANSLAPVKIDIVYWLKFDENHNILQGDFISNNGASMEYINAHVWSPLSAIIEESKKYCSIAGGINSTNVLVHDIISLYLDSLSC